ncbi:hypothetical protein GCM10027562_04530 [Arthrobacter pigmenti]
MSASLIRQRYAGVNLPVKTRFVLAQVLRNGRIRAMTSRIAALAIDSIEPHMIARFWCSVLDWRILEAVDDGVSIAPRDRDWPTIDIFGVPERKSLKNRLHLDLRADGSSTAGELQRLLDLGAVHVDVGQGPEVTWVVLADPEGNEFCLLSRTVQELAGP